MSRATYRIFAVQHAHRETTWAEVFYGDHTSQPISMDYFVWAVTDGARTLVVAPGFTEEVGRRRGRQFLRSPERGLAELGIDAARVEDVAALVRANYEDRVAFSESEHEVWPGVRVHKVGGHMAAIWARPAGA